MSFRSRISWNEGDKVQDWAKRCLAFYETLQRIGFVCRDEGDANEINLARRLIRQYEGKK